MRVKNYNNNVRKVGELNILTDFLKSEKFFALFTLSTTLILAVMLLFNNTIIEKEKHLYLCLGFVFLYFIEAVANHSFIIFFDKFEEKAIKKTHSDFILAGSCLVSYFMLFYYAATSENVEMTITYLIFLVFYILNPILLGVVKKYIKTHPTPSLEELKEDFFNTLKKDGAI